MRQETCLKRIKEYAEKIRKTQSEVYYKGGLDIIRHANEIIAIAKKVEKGLKSEVKDDD